MLKSELKGSGDELKWTWSK